MKSLVNYILESKTISDLLMVSGEFSAYYDNDDNVDINFNFEKITPYFVIAKENIKSSGRNESIVEYDGEEYTIESDLTNFGTAEVKVGDYAFEYDDKIQIYRPNINKLSIVGENSFSPQTIGTPKEFSDYFDEYFEDLFPEIEEKDIQTTKKQISKLIKTAK